MVRPPAGSRASKLVDFDGFLVVLLPDSLPVGVDVSLACDLLSPLLLSLLLLSLLLLLPPVCVGAAVLVGVSEDLLLSLLLLLLLLLLLSVPHCISVHDRATWIHGPKTYCHSVVQKAPP